MSETTRGQLPLFPARPPPPPAGAPGVPAGAAPSDAAARQRAVDPTRNVVLEASAGTGKTSVLVARYLNLLRAGVDPANVLAITFTRQAAAEMRERIVQQLRTEAGRSPAGRARWDDLRDRLGEVAISTVDAFCLSLLREYPLEADLDPGFGIADETEIPRIIEQATEHALGVCGGIARDDSNVAMLLAQLGPWRLRVALTHLLRRRLVVPGAMHRFLAGTPAELTAEEACRRAVTRLVDRLAGMASLVERLIGDGPIEHARFAVVARDLAGLGELGRAEPARVRATLDRLRAYFVTQKGTPRKTFPAGRLKSGTAAHTRYRDAAVALARVVHDVLRAFDRDLNVALVRGAQRVFGVAVSECRRQLESRALLDFSDVLERAVDLLSQMDEFARSRYRLESRYHHVLVDEFQDTSRAQWELVSILVRSWGEGSGLTHEAPLPPTLFIVGDRKQSIYRFRDADVAILRDAAHDVAGLRDQTDDGGTSDVREWLSHSFRAVSELLAFVNDLFAEVDKAPDRRDAFRFDAADRFPDESVEPPATRSDDASEPLGIVVGPDVERCAEGVAAEVARLLRASEVRDKESGRRRAVRPGDMAILFRSRESHREFGRALEARAIPTYVYKSLGFFDADEIKDVRALLRFLANPHSELRAAALLRSHLIRVSDITLTVLAGQLSAALVDPVPPTAMDALGDDDRRALERARASVPEWLAFVDRLTPAELLDRVLRDSAYAFELRGGHVVQARENLKKMRGLVRRAQNRGYATMARVADHIDHLSGDVSNAIVDAFDAVNLMTVHAAKGLEFPVVFLVDLGRGTGTQTPAIRVVTDAGDGRPSVSVWPFRAAADEDERHRDVEESKRLLYVAATRARDRLYLSALVDDDGLKVNRGSLGEVLPNTFRSVLERAPETPAGEWVDWVSSSGGTHRLRVCGTGH